MAYYSKKKGEGLRIVLCARTNRVLQGNAFCNMISCVHEVKLIQCSIFVYLQDKKPLTWGWHYLLVRLTAASIRCLFPDDLRTRVWQICGRKAHEGQNFSFSMKEFSIIRFYLRHQRSFSPLLMHLDILALSLQVSFQCFTSLVLVLGYFQFSTNQVEHLKSFLLALNNFLNLQITPQDAEPGVTP